MSRERRRLLADRHRRLRSGSIAPPSKGGATNELEVSLIEPELTSFLRAVVFDFSSVAFIDTTAIKALHEVTPCCCGSPVLVLDDSLRCVFPVD
jgi:hypothetical protein